jgi:uncharacterized membrane protein
MPDYPADSAPPDSERLLVLLSYGLFLIAPTSGGVTALIGVVIAHIRLAHAIGTLHESHYRNQIRVFWTFLIFVLVMSVAMSLGLGFSLFSLAWPFSPGWPFWPAAFVGMGWAFLLPVLGFLFLILILWYYWRMLRGFVRELDDQPY